MTPQTANLPIQGMMAGFRRFSVAEYHKLIALGILTEDDNLELLEGYLVHKMSRNPPHDATLQKALKRLLRLLPAGWDLRAQSAVTLPGSEPEPDLSVVRGDENDYVSRHPGPADIGLVVEVADSTLPSDRADKGRIYARAGLACYWIINVADRQVEVYTVPSGPASSPSYGQRTDYRVGDQVPLVLDGATVTHIDVRDLLL
ncbi:MAG TPA: Uma2 family endonuclease [Gemmataceae bacterium]|nr:Uma2 family endonuclease [Gemmataceae bacterium]